MLKKVLTNVVIIVLASILSMLLIELGFAIEYHWVWPSAGQAIGLLAGVVAAIRYRAVVALLVLGSLAAMTIANFAIHAWMGIEAAQGLDAHVAPILAGLIGIGCALAFRRRAAVGTPID